MQAAAAPQAAGRGSQLRRYVSVERAALYIAAAELIDPRPVRQLATLDTPIGLHTFPVENGAPIILDPRVPRNALAGMFLHGQAPVAIDARDAIEWTAQACGGRCRGLSERAEPRAQGAQRDRAARRRGHRTGLRRGGRGDRMAARARGEGRPPLRTARDLDRPAAQAIADLAEEALARSQRNLALEIGGTRLQPAPWMSALARIAGRVGVNVGAVALRTKLASLGIGDDLVGLVEDELNREGLTLGPVARPPKLPTFGTIATKKAA